MSAVINLATQLKEYLPGELSAFLQRTGEVAGGQGQAIYLVGGGVRDLLLGRANFDLDLVVEGDAIALANKLAEDRNERIIIHPRFGTAKLRQGNFSIDLATARCETYARPGVLPAVTLGSTIKEDLFRRDFTINTMAIRLDSARYGELIDPYGGKSDLEHRLIRILHRNSFIDDATRILRGIRYEQRLGFQMEHNTEILLNDAVPMLGTVSGDRLRHELELILREEYPEKVFYRAEGLGILKEAYPPLAGDGWLEEKFERARALRHTSPHSVYMPLLIYHFSEQECQNFIERFRIPAATARIMRDTLHLKVKLHILANPHLAPSAVYNLLQSYSPTAISAVAVASDDTTVRRHLHLYLKKLRYVKTSLNGDSLMLMGLPAGKRLGEILNALKKARLDGRVKTKKEEEDLIHLWLSKEGYSSA